MSLRIRITLASINVTSLEKDMNRKYMSNFKRTKKIIRNIKKMGRKEGRLLIV
jgi:hypothetical protein